MNKAKTSYVDAFFFFHIRRKVGPLREVWKGKKCVRYVGYIDLNHPTVLGKLHTVTDGVGGGAKGIKG